MKKIFLINLFLILGLSFAHSMDDTPKVKGGVNPTSITTRSKFFKTHLDDDQAIFKEMSKWHEEDYAALAQVVKVDANQGKMKLIHDTLNKIFDNGAVTHGKIAAAYKAYSAVISSNSEMGHAQDTEDDRSVDDTIQEVIEFCIDGKIREQTPHLTSNIYQITLAEKYNLRWLPYVSRKGLSTFRTLNSQFGMKAPLVGLPFESSSYDGNLDETPFSFFRHDANHGRFSDANNDAPKVIDFIYACYHEADAIVSHLTDTKIQALCDFFLFEVGHELFFDIQTIWGDEMDNEGHWKRTFTLQYPKDLDEICDNIVKHLEEEIRQFSQPSPLYTHREIMDMKLIEERKDREELKDSVETMRKSIRDRESILSPFINPNRDGQQLFTLIELVNKFKLSKEKPVSKKEIADSIQPGFLNTLPPGPWNPFKNWCMLELKLNAYNQLFGYQYFFNKNGISFDLWKDDVFQADTIISVFKDACDTFKREVGTRFKGYETYLAKLDKIKDENSLKVQHYPTF